MIDDQRLRRLGEHLHGIAATLLRGNAGIGEADRIGTDGNLVAGRTGGTRDELYRSAQPGRFGMLHSRLAEDHHRGAGIGQLADQRLGRIAGRRLGQLGGEARRCRQLAGLVGGAGKAEDDVDHRRRGNDLLAGKREVEIEIQRIDDMHPGPGIDRLAQAMVEQGHLMARVAADEEDGRGLFEIGNRHLERTGVRGVGEIELAQAMVDCITAKSTHETGQQVAFLVRGQRCHQRTEIGSRAAQPFGDKGEGFGPTGLDQLAVLADHRHARAIFRIQAFVAVAIAIGQPAFVDRLVVTRHRAQYFAATRVQPQVRAERIVIADRFAGDQFPSTGTETERLVGQRTDRADIDHVARQLAHQRLADVGADLQALAALHAAKFVGAGHFGHDPDAARAMDAAGHLGFNQRAEILVSHHALAFDETTDGAAKSERQILQLALATLVAHRAIQRMVDEQELHRIALRRQRALRLREHFHAIGNRGRTRGLRLRHRPSAHLDLDHAHAAIGGDGQFFVVAETRNCHTDAIGGLDDHRALRRKHLGAVNLDRDVIGRCARSHRLRAHAWAPVEAGIRDDQPYGC